MDLPSVSELSVSTQNYLKAIWSLQEWSSRPVTAGLVATRVGVKTSTVSGALAKLAEQGLVLHDPYGSIELTASGRSMALSMVRRHRLIETFLVEVLGYRWDQVDDEAEHLEHAVSDFMVERIDEYLGHPTRDPHGDPIPDVTGEITMPAASVLTDAAPGTVATIERISDRDPDLLKFLEDQGLVPGVEITVAPAAPFSDTIAVVTEAGPAPITLGRTASDALFVKPRP